MMPDLENYLLSAVFFVLLCIIFFFWKRRKKGGSSSNQRKFIIKTLEDARAQYENFNLKSDQPGENRKGITAFLERVEGNSLHLEAGSYVPQELQNTAVDIFFKVRQDEGPVFYTFKSTIQKVSPDYEHSTISVALPDHLIVEKKRHFMRVTPGKNDVQVIGVWLLKPGSHLPHSSAEIGSPVTQYRQGRTDKPVQVENVSASGIALRFKLDRNGKLPFEFQRGSQLLCLVVLAENDMADKHIAFWCTGEIMNSRKTSGQEPELVLGLEYTNWAELEKGSNDIHWAHSSPTKGAKPIRQWVEKAEQRQNAHEGQ